jgi:hypothetical protein
MQVQGPPPQPVLGDCVGLSLAEQPGRLTNRLRPEAAIKALLLSSHAARFATLIQDLGLLLLPIERITELFVRTG